MDALSYKYTQELADDVFANMVECYPMGETVCGALDPAIVEVSEAVGKKYPELAGRTMVRITERYVSPWSSETSLEFSDREITPEEYRQYEQYADDYE